MIEILINGTALQIPEGTRLNLKGKSPIFDRGSFSGVRNLPFKIPATQHNLSLLGMYNELHLATLPDPIECQVLWNGYQHLKGELIIEEATRRYLKVRVKDRLADFADTYGSASIRDLSLGTQTVQTTLAQVDFEITDATPLNLFTIYLNGNTYTYTTTSGDVVGDVVIALMGDINTDFPGYATAPASDTLRVKQPTTADEYEIGWDPAGSSSIWNVSPTTLVDARQANYKTLINNVISFPGSYDWWCPTMYMPYAYGEKNSEWLNYANYFGDVSTGPAINTAQTNARRWEYTFLPCVYLSVVVEQIFTTAGWNLTIDSAWQSATDWDDLLLINEYAQDEVLREWNEGSLSWEYVNAFKRSFTLAECLPDITIRELLNGIRVLFCADFDIDYTEKTFTIRPAAPAFTSGEENTITASVEHNILYESKPGFTFRHNKDDDAGYTAHPISKAALLDYVHGDGLETIEGSLSVPVTRFIKEDGIRAPEIHRQLSSDELDQGYDTWPARLIWKRRVEVVGGTGSSRFIYGSSDDGDPFGAGPGGYKSMAWEGSTGLIATHWSEWLDFYDERREVELLVDPKQITPALLDYYTPLRIAGGVYLIKEYSINLPTHRPQQLKLYKK